MTGPAMPNCAQFVDDHVLLVGNYRFHCEHHLRAVTPGTLQVEKPRELVEDYMNLCRELQPRRIVELGVYKGGSTALLSELAEPEKLVALELSEEPVPILSRYVEERGLTDVVRPHYGVDQSDRARVAEIVRAEFGDEPIDLVLDDASHLYEETKSSFETLFPTLKPGGLFILEDWRWRHQFAEAFATATDLPEPVLEAIAQRIVDVAEGRGVQPVPMSRLVLELVLARASAGGAVAEINVGGDWVVVVRGPDALDRENFRIGDIARDAFGQLSPIH